ncbi:MAG: MarR family winged helix-turn-helix transcriptional regulator [Phycisphaerales bacterium]|nr:MarR family winged helix-turn-helix transcriptional regulator [Phycisphaerales bacterium]
MSDRILAGLSKLSLVMRHESWRAAGQRGLTPTQAQILSILAGSANPIGPKEVARQMAITLGTASEAISSLVSKGLVRKATSETDGRAVVLSLTKPGVREAATASAWPASMVEAIDALPESERTGLLRGLIGMIRTLQEQGAVPTARMCVGCTYFRPNEYPDTPKPHHCLLIDAPIANSDLRIDCPEMEPAAEEVRPKLWSVFVNGQPLDNQGPGHRRSPSKSRRFNPVSK